MSTPPTVAARPARTDDAAAIAAIYCDTLGAGYTTRAEVAGAIRSGGDRSCWFVAEADGAVVGAADGSWRYRREMPGATLPGFERVADRLLALAPGAERLGLLENVGVLPGYRGRRLAAALTEARLRWLRDRGADFVYTFAWHTPDGIAALPTLERAGFRPVEELPDFYLEDGLRNGYACPWCGRECRCSALLCVRQGEVPVGA